MNVLINLFVRMMELLTSTPDCVRQLFKPATPDQIQFVKDHGGPEDIQAMIFPGR